MSTSTPTAPIVAAAEETGLTMDAEHRYRINGAEIPSVTQVISAILPGWQADPWYMQRGTAMHHGCRLMDEGRLDWSSVSPEIEGRLRAWEQFRADHPSTIGLSEFSLSHHVYRFAGTLDRTLLGNLGTVIADIKSTICPQVQLQLGGYSILLDGYGMSTKRLGGVAVELSDNGTYRTKWFTPKEIEHGSRMFLACLTIYGFKRKEGLK